MFDSVASKYDLMNDLMSLGAHRAWKAYAVTVANVRPGDKVLDIAAGTGDLTRAFARQAGAAGQVVHTDINEAMLRAGRDRLLDEGLVLPSIVCDAEQLPFRSGSFDLVSVAFGLRNMTHKDRALAEMCRVLRPGGRLLVLEFSKVAGGAAASLTTGTPSTSCRAWGSGSPATARAIATLPNRYACTRTQQELKAMMKVAGFGHVDVHNLSAGVVALHVGVKC